MPGFRFSDSVAMICATIGIGLATPAAHAAEPIKLETAVTIAFARSLDSPAPSLIKSL